MSGSCSASSAQELAGYLRERPGSIQRIASRCRVEISGLTNSLLVEAEHPSPPATTSLIVEQESAVEPPVAADSTKRVAANTWSLVFRQLITSHSEPNFPYLPPEVMCHGGKQAYSYAQVDVWSFGMFMYYHIGAMVQNFAGVSPGLKKFSCFLVLLLAVPNMSHGQNDGFFNVLF